MIDRVQRGEIDRLAIHMPPRHGKTETVTVRAGAFFKELHPEANVLVTAYNQRIANRFSRKSRTICKDRVNLSQDNKAQDEWSLPEGGTYMARGVGSPPTGVASSTSSSMTLFEAVRMRNHRCTVTEQLIGILMICTHALNLGAPSSSCVHAGITMMSQLVLSHPNQTAGTS